MLSPLKDLLRDYRLVLASSSIQRNAIWQQMGFEFVSMPSPYDEDSVKQTDFSSPNDYVRHLARGKAAAVVDDLKASPNCQASIVIGADTVIVADDLIIGKPHTSARAIEFLKILSGKTHEVKTGVAMLLLREQSQDELDSFVCTTKVTMSSLSEALIQSYVKTGEPLNKAGAYGIQGLGARLVERIDGDYYNVVGFPINSFCQKLEEILQRRTS